MGLHKYITLSILEIDDLSDHEFACGEIEELIHELFQQDFEDTSWWDQDEEMKILSLFFPDFTFCLDVDQGGTEWYKSYYRNGKEQTCVAELVYETFDESKFN